MFTEIKMINYAMPLAARLASRKICGPYSWRPSTAPSEGRSFYQASRYLGMDEHGSTFKLRLEEAGEARRGYAGYYADEDGNTILSPIIARLNHGRGFLAGWTMGGGMCASLSCYVWPDIDEAKRAAHDEAERAAELEREEEARYQAELEREEEE